VCGQVGLESRQQASKQYATSPRNWDPGSKQKAIAWSMRSMLVRSSTTSESRGTLPPTPTPLGHQAPALQQQQWQRHVVTAAGASNVRLAGTA
jgi:hypothetical protein